MTAGPLPLFVLLATSPAPGASPTAPGRLEEITQQIAGRQPSAPIWLVILTGFGALIFVGTALVSRLGDAGHEGAHALAASLTGEVTGVKIPWKGNPVTSMKVAGMSDFASTFAGYAGPPMFGLLGAWLLSRDHPVAVLWLAIVLFAGLLWLIRNLYGAVLVVALGGTLLLVAWNATLGAQTVVAYLLVWSLLLIGSRHVRPFLKRAARKIDRKAPMRPDHLVLRDLTYIPQILWVLLHLALCWAALAFGAWLMLA